MGVELDKLYTSATFKVDAAINDALFLDKAYVVAVYRAPETGLGEASGSGGARAQAKTLIATRPNQDISRGGWKNETGGIVLHPSIAKAEVDDSTYIIAEAGENDDTARIKLADPQYELGEEVYLDYRFSKWPTNTVQSVDLTIRLVQGASTLIGSWVHTDISTTVVDVTQTLTGPQIATITDFSDLYLEFISRPY